MTSETATLTRSELEDRMASYRAELTGYCYRLLGSPFEAEDAVQETMVRAWRSLDRFEGRAALRTWLYRIATNVCTDLAAGRARRARPMDLSGPSAPSDGLPAPLPESTWVLPAPDGALLAGAAGGGGAADPAELTVARESVRLALIVALQRLAPRQRAVLILREVLGWSAAETAELLETSVAAVNSALQRARATLAAAQPAETDPLLPTDDDQKELLARYVEAFESYDMEALTALLHEDATMTMPPLDLWLRGPQDIVEFMLGPGRACENSRLVPTSANGMPAFGHYKLVPPEGAQEYLGMVGMVTGAPPAVPEQDGESWLEEPAYLPWSLIVLELSEGRIAGLNHFLNTARLFPLFGLPEQVSA